MNDTNTFLHCGLEEEVYMQLLKSYIDQREPIMCFEINATAASAKNIH